MTMKLKDLNYFTLFITIGLILFTSVRIKSLFVLISKNNFFPSYQLSPAPGARLISLLRGVAYTLTTRLDFLELRISTTFFSFILLFGYGSAFISEVDVGFED
jgi:hypothetical protein